MSFEYPLLLLFLIPLFGFWAIRFRRTKSREENRRYPWLIFATAMTILAVARPYWSTTPSLRMIKGVDIVLAMDVSQSMFCRNQEGRSRLDEARIFLRSLLPQFSGSQIAVVYFSGDAQIGSPFTNDLYAIYLFLDSISPAMTSNPGTQVASLQKSLRDLLMARTGTTLSATTRPLILLFSDGEFFDEPQGLASWLSRNRDLRLFAFACGSGKSPVPKYDLSGPSPNAFSQVRIETLQELANAANGSVFNLSRANTTLVATEVLQRVKDFVAEGESVPRYQSGIFLILSLACLIVYQFALPFFQIWKQATAIVLLPCLLFATVAMKSATDRSRLFSSAIDDSRQKKYDQALEKLRRLEKEHRSDAIDIAIGNVLFHQGKYDESIRYYRSALSKNKNNQTARWNWEVVLKVKSQPNKPPQQQPSPQYEPPKIPDQTESLLKFFDQLEKDQMQQQHQQTANTSKFEW